MILCPRPVLLLVAGVILLVGGLAQAQPEKDLLEQAKLRQEVEAQRVEQAALEADRNATQIGRADPVRAVEILRSALTMLDADVALPEAKRASLKRRLDLSLRAYQGRAADLQKPPLTTGPGIADIRSQAEDRQRQEQAQTARMLQQIRELRAAGKTYEANRLQDELNQRAPTNPAVGAASIINTRNEFLADNRRIGEQRNAGWLGVQREIEKSAIPEVREYVLPADWAEKSKRRSPAMQMTKAERAILEALNRPVSVDFDGMKFDDVMQYLEKQIGQPIVVPKGALDEAQITTETPVKLKADRVSMRTVLRKVLGEVGLTYIVKDQAIQVSTVRAARETLSTRTYYIGDLVAAVDVRWGPIYNQLQMSENVNRIMNLITQSIDPMSWEMNGGLGRIAFDPITMSIVIRQTSEVHMMLGIGLR